MLVESRWRHWFASSWTGVMDVYMGTRAWTLVLWKSSQCSDHWAFFTDLNFSNSWRKVFGEIQLQQYSSDHLTVQLPLHSNCECYFTWLSGAARTRIHVFGLLGQIFLTLLFFALNGSRDFLSFSCIKIWLHGTMRNLWSGGTWSLLWEPAEMFSSVLDVMQMRNLRIWVNIPGLDRYPQKSFSHPDKIWLVSPIPFFYNQLMPQTQ